ncbi:Hsp33 family molecular chaperone HslO [Sphingomonas jatrophae]|uniref:Molecular chaperone Hsp33 n=1 Tax=Sphingomonas jatrophae TaxID=1166337 RepID=A0A1I6JY82_9SPHN|nr:Hsp33 family molecular chaperone HslO [Sphingomonas jatrophae]SFR83939.1 molecular chaperone Hsp33 [Sphingomonas jatrophae]
MADGLGRVDGNGEGVAFAGEVDSALGFLIPSLHVRGRAVRLSSVLDQILAHHDYPPALERVLAEALTVTALLGSTLKDEAGQLTLQAQTENGAVDLLVCDYRAGVMRGYVRHDPERLGSLPADPILADLFGTGYLAITFDLATTGERYQGIVPLEGASLAEAVESYFAQSEQLPSLVRVGLAGARGAHVAGGLLVQHLPEGEEGRERLHTRLDHPEWEAAAALAQTVRGGELSDPALPLDGLIWRLFNEQEVRVLPAVPLSHRCRCDPEHFAQVLARFPEEERAEMADEAGDILVDCEFCASTYRIPLTRFD